MIINQLKKAGFTGKIMVADGSVDPSLAKIAGTGGEGVFATMTQTPDSLKGAEKWIANYKTKFSSDPGPYSTQSYDAVRLAAKAIDNAGSTAWLTRLLMYGQLRSFGIPLSTAPLMGKSLVVKAKR